MSIDYKLLLLLLIIEIQSKIYLSLQGEINNLINPSNEPNYDDVYCELPTNDPNIQSVLTSKGGWATIDQKCKSGNWCPYSCKPGYYTNQWDPSIKCLDLNHCGSTHGGVFCNQGKLVYPFPDEPLCKKGIDGVFLINKKERPISVCQTVYPGSEIMLISTPLFPNKMQPLTTLPKDYWMNTSAHFYVNPLNTNDQHCNWGNANDYIGNWAPYLFGTNLGYQNNIYFRMALNPNFNLKHFNTIGYNLSIDCLYGECINTPCNLVDSKECIVTVKENSRAIVTFS